jgi:HK97 gp10 family phage protein
MADQNIKITGLESVMKMLDELPVKTEKKFVRGALRKISKGFAAELQVRAPRAQEHHVDPELQLPPLWESIKIAGAGSRNGLVKIKIKGNFYARFLELGTFRMEPKPFIRPTMDARSGPLLQQFCDLVASSIEKNGPSIDE